MRSLPPTCPVLSYIQQGTQGKRQRPRAPAAAARRAGADRRGAGQLCEGRNARGLPRSWAPLRPGKRRQQRYWRMKPEGGGNGGGRAAPLWQSKAAGEVRARAARGGRGCFVPTARARARALGPRLPRQHQPIRPPAAHRAGARGAGAKSVGGEQGGRVCTAKGFPRGGWWMWRPGTRGHRVWLARNLRRRRGWCVGPGGPREKQGGTQNALPKVFLGFPELLLKTS